MKSNKTIPTSTAAGLRTLGAPSFVVLPETSTWRYAVGTHGIQVPVDVPNPMVDRNRVAAKQDRPPRGVPR